MSDKDSKKASGKKASSKLGHDPLAWIEPDETSGDKEPSIPVQALQDIAVSSAAEAKSSDNDVVTAVLTLPAYFGISQAAAVHADMQKIFNEGRKQVEIAGDEVESMDTSAVQLLLAFVNEARSEGIQLSWLNYSKKIESVAGMLGINSQLMIQS
jgi:anti-anti-sigma regulatory factor